jgi:hypothetical protein
VESSPTASPVSSATAGVSRVGGDYGSASVRRSFRREFGQPDIAVDQGRGSVRPVQARGRRPHLRTTNPIESTFAIVRHRTKITKGPGSRAAGLAMAFKLIESAQTRWRAVNAPHLVTLVRAGARFDNGKLVERPDEHAPPTAA